MAQTEPQWVTDLQEIPQEPTDMFIQHGWFDSDGSVKWASYLVLQPVCRKADGSVVVTDYYYPEWDDRGFAKNTRSGAECNVRIARSDHTVMLASDAQK